MDEPHVLDVRKLLCPLPVIRLQQAMTKLEPNEKLLIIASDPGVQYDIPTWCRIHEHEVLSMQTIGREIHIEVQAKASGVN